MADKNVVKNQQAERRRMRVRKKVHGTAECPRLAVTKSLKNIAVQIIDDDKMVTLVGLATNSKDFRDKVGDKDNKTAAAKKIGLEVARLAKDKGIEAVVFDRNRFRYHGRIKAVADGAREGGLKF